MIYSLEAGFDILKKESDIRGIHARTANLSSGRNSLKVNKLPTSAIIQLSRKLTTVSCRYCIGTYYLYRKVLQTFHLGKNMKENIPLSPSTLFNAFHGVQWENMD